MLSLSIFKFYLSKLKCFLPRYNINWNLFEAIDDCIQKIDTLNHLGIPNINKYTHYSTHETNDAVIEQIQADKTRLTNRTFSKALTTDLFLSFGTADVQIIIASASDNPFGTPVLSFGSSLVTSQTHIRSRQNFTSLINLLADFSVRTSPIGSYFVCSDRDSNISFPVRPAYIVTMESGRWWWQYLLWVHVGL